MEEPRTYDQMGGSEGINKMQLSLHDLQTLKPHQRPCAVPSPTPGRQGPNRGEWYGEQYCAVESKRVLTPRLSNGSWASRSA